MPNHIYIREWAARRLQPTGFAITFKRADQSLPMPEMGFSDIIRHSPQVTRVYCRSRLLGKEVSTDATPKAVAFKFTT